MKLAGIEREATPLAHVRGLVFGRRQNTSDRFRNTFDWIRLAMLGIVIVDIGLFAIHRSISGTVLLNYLPGMPAVFGGVFLAVIIIKIGRPALYLDWITLGGLYVAAGMVLANNASLSTALSQASFLVSLLAACALTAFIGITLDTSIGDPGWITSAGLTGFFCAGWVIVGPAIQLAISPDIILAVDLILIGIGIAGFGLSLRKSGPRYEK